MPDLKISQLPVASATTGAELFPVVQGGVTKQIALNAVRHIGSAVFDANGSMAVDTSTLFVDAVNNRVGVGTATPSGALDIYSGASGATAFTNGNNLVVQNSGAVGMSLLSPDANAARIYFGTPSNNRNAFIYSDYNGGLQTLIFGVGVGATAATEKMRIDSSGNPGIGVTPSAWGIGKAIEVGATGNAIWGVQAADMRLLVNAYYDGTNYRYNHTATAGRYDCGAIHSWFTAPSGTAGNAISFTQAMTLDASSNLLVGPTSGVGGAKVAASGTFLSTTNTLSTFSGAYGGFDWTSRSLRLFAGTADATGSQIEFYAGVSGAINVKARIDNTATAGHTALLLWDVDNATLERVTVGAADSGGTGFKVLRIPN